MVAVPELTPVAMPVDEPILAIAVLLLLHVPPAVASLSVVLNPTHRLLLPVMAAGDVLTVSVEKAAQPVGNL